MAVNSQQSLRAFIIDPLANLDTTACSLLPSLPNLSHYIRSGRHKKNQAPPIPPKGNGYVIPDDCKFLEIGEIFLLFDTREHNVDRILVFDTESGLDNLAKYKD